MKRASLLLVAGFAALLLYAEGDLPRKGDPSAPAGTHVAARYVERTLEETHTPNVVTSMLADYRGFDTLGESVVVFTAALCCVLILTAAKAAEREE